MDIAEKTLKKRILKRIQTEFHSFVIEALDFAERKYQGSTRISGESLLSHTMKMAQIVIDMGLDVNSVIAAILHACPKCVSSDETDYCNKNNSNDLKDLYASIEKTFGKDVVFLLKRFYQLLDLTKRDADPAAITRYILKESEDLRVLMLRLADRLDSARTIEVLSPERRMVSAQKFLRIYAPLAEYLNFTDMKNEFERIGFRVSNPDEFERIDKYLEKNSLKNNEVLEKIQDILEHTCERIGCKARIFGRIKNHYSIFRKMKKYSDEGKAGNILAMRDILAFSIVTDSVSSCYEICSSILGNTESLPDMFEDYIAKPKPNGFREIQIAAKFQEIKDIFVEIQILTEEMYDHNTYGAASHFGYKIQGKRFASPDNEFNWVKEIHSKIHKGGREVSVLSEPLISDLFQRDLFVWTPQYRLINLPLGSTALDFAFKIHTEIGMKVTGAEINGKKEQLDYVLKNGDVVKILTHPNKSIKTTATREWLKNVKTERARKKIEKALRNW